MKEIKVFIGGSRSISRLNKIVKDKIDEFINNQYTIYIGDANGSDKAVQKYLFEKGYKNVIVFCVGDKYRNNIGGWKVEYVSVNGAKKRTFEYYVQKDLEMAKRANFGFMIWDGKSRGTFNNILNLLKMNKKVLIYFSLDKKIYDIATMEMFNEWLSKYKNSDISLKMKLDFFNKSNFEFQKQLSLNF